MAITARLITESSITLIMNGKQYILTEDNHQHYTELRNALKKNDIPTIERLIDLPKQINHYGNGKITVVDGVVMYNGDELHNSLTRRLLRQMDEGFEVTSLINFLENLMKNPSMVARKELYDWLEENNNPITEDGCFIAFKNVQKNYMDHYTGTIRNAIGDTPKMDRASVDDNRHNTCSAGLHFASESYLPHYTGGGENNRTMILKVNPADVVSIPVDYNHAKGRCWTYEVIGELDDDGFQKFYKTAVHGATPNAREDDLVDEVEEEVVAAPVNAAVTPDRVYIVRSYNDYTNGANVTKVDAEVYEEGKRVTLAAARSLAESVMAQEDVDRVRIIDSITQDTILVFEYEEVTDEVVEVAEAPKAAWPMPTAKPAVAPAKAPVKAANPFEGLTFTKTQVCAILGVDMVTLDEMLEDGTKVERVVRGGKGFVVIK
jgi:hypothetical protein